MNNKRVYVISRYHADTKEETTFNENVARYFCREIASDGNIPVAPHLFFPRFLDDFDSTERAFGLYAAKRELAMSNEYLLVIVDGIISKGMWEEMQYLEKLGIKGRIVTRTKEEIKKQIKLELGL